MAELPAHSRQTDQPGRVAIAATVETQKDPRPFYGEFTWAYDLLIDRPVERECETITTWLVERGVVPGAMLLDAGCGTGCYARELGRRGYRVHGIDRSLNLLEEAKYAAGGQPLNVFFTVGDIRTLPSSKHDAILCRGVLNDLVNDDDNEPTPSRDASCSNGEFNVDHRS
jgi:2-polyprenyl-3-methyl-5-hydroxy-6-metoxy-1,4-benzoquinol methylase